MEVRTSHYHRFLGDLDGPHCGVLEEQHLKACCFRSKIISETEVGIWQVEAAAARYLSTQDEAFEMLKGKPSQPTSGVIFLYIYNRDIWIRRFSYWAIFDDTKAIVFLD